MTNNKRTKKEIPAHLKYLTPLPDEKADPEEYFDSWFPGGKADLEREKALHESRQILFKETKNPLFAWDIYSRSRRKETPVPEWVMEYLDGVARRMLKSENKTADLPEIFGFHQDKKTRNGGRQAWGQYRQRCIREEAVGHALNYLSVNPNKTIDDACLEAAKRTFEKWGETRECETIKKWYHDR